METSFENLKQIKEILKKQKTEVPQENEDIAHQITATDASMEEEIKSLLQKIENEELSFSKFIPEVKPIAQDKIFLKLGETLTAEQAKIKQKSAESESYKEHYNFSTQNIKYLDPFEITGFSKNGVQRGVYLKVKNAEYQIKACLDLHNHTLEQARVAVDKFLETSFNKGYRFIIIVHGKGEYTKPPAFLKSFVFTWLKEADNVIAAHHAMPYHGGPGATYALLKKNEQQKADNREKFSSL